MPKVYDDWERLVQATLRREQLWQLCHEHSRTPSDGSTTTSGASPSSSSPITSVVPTDSKHHVNHRSPLVEAEVKKDKLMKTSGASPNSSSPIPNVVPTDSKHPVNHRSLLVEAEVKKDKLMKRGKSRMRLDRWILTRWLSNTLMHK